MVGSKYLVLVDIPTLTSWTIEVGCTGNHVLGIDPPFVLI